MNKNLVAFLILQMILFVGAQAPITPNVANIAGVKISEGAYYYPYPAEPGRYIDVYVKVQSAVETTITNLTCYLDPKYPFSIDNLEDGRYNLGNFKKNDIALMKFKVRISENAVTGTNKLKIVCKISGYLEETAELPIYIQSQDAVIMISKVSSVPAEFKPNQIGNVTLELENIAGASLKDITVKLDLSGQDVPFVPVNETTEKRIPLIEAGKKTAVSFSIKSMADATAKSYKIPVTMTYYDMLGKSYSKSTIISLDVNTEPALLALHDQTTIVRNNAKSTIPISIINRGESKIAFTTVYFLTDGNAEYTLLSPAVYYIGDINSDDSEVAEFELYINTTDKKINLPIKIVYKDAIGNVYEQKESVEVNVFSKEDALKYGYDKVTATDPIILIAAAFVFLYLVYKFVLPRFRKKKKTEFNE
ncbi:MAG: hypothetical protein N3G74_01565 [Candidatus Micrarchaeota archaeon]|nr:hypothetical protein [Candidatus Micrarchaeota archaeon]